MLKITMLNAFNVMIKYKQDNAELRESFLRFFLPPWAEHKFPECIELIKEILSTVYSGFEGPDSKYLEETQQRLREVLIKDLEYTERFF